MEQSKFEFLKHIPLYSFSGGLAVHKKGNSRQPTLSENVIKRKTCEDLFYILTLIGFDSLRRFGVVRVML